MLKSIRLLFKKSYMFCPFGVGKNNLLNSLTLSISTVLILEKLNYLVTSPFFRSFENFNIDFNQHKNSIWLENAI